MLGFQQNNIFQKSKSWNMPRNLFHMSKNPDLKQIRKSGFSPSLLAAEAGLYIYTYVLAGLAFSGCYTESPVMLGTRMIILISMSRPVCKFSYVWHQDATHDTKANDCRISSVSPRIVAARKAPNTIVIVPSKLSPPQAHF